MDNIIKGFERNEQIGEYDEGEDYEYSVRFSEIFGTGFRWDVPYLMDVDKYREVMGGKTRMSDEEAASVRMSVEMKSDMDADDGTLEYFTVFIASNRGNEKGVYSFDNILFDSAGRDENYTMGDMEEFMKRLTGCITGGWTRTQLEGRLNGMSRR